MKMNQWDLCMVRSFKNEYVSVSRLKKLEHCPQSFLFSYVLGLPRGEYGPPAAFGVMMHEAFEALMRWVKENKIQGIVPIEKAYEFFRNAWAFSDVSDPKYYAEGIAIIDGYFNRFPDVDYKEILGIEVKFNIKIQGVDVLGYMDRVDRIGDDIHIVDYKTNKQMYQREDLAIDIQASVYTIAARILWPWAKRIIFHFEMLRHDTRQTVERTPAQLELAADYVVDMTKQSERQGRSWSAKVGPLCAFCDHFTKCETVQESIANGTEIIPVDTDDLLQVVKERQRLKAVLTPIKSQMDKLDRVIKSQVDKSKESVVIGEYRYRTVTIKRKTFDLDMTVKLFEGIGMDPKVVTQKILSVDKKAVDALAKEVKADIKGTGSGARKAMFVMDLEACADEEFAYSKLDSRLAEHVLAPSQESGQLTAKEVPCDFCGAKPAKLVERGGSRFAVCPEHKKKRKAPPKQIAAPDKN